MYARVADAWARSRSGFEAARRAEHVLDLMWDEYERDRNGALVLRQRGGSAGGKAAPVLDAVLKAWARCSAQGRDRPERAEALLRKMEELSGVADEIDAALLLMKKKGRGRASAGRTADGVGDNNAFGRV